MLFKSTTLSNPKDNVLFDEALLQMAEAGEGGEVLRIWESPKLFVVLGRICKLEDDVRIDATTKDVIPIVRRTSGGGTVLQGEGCLNYSLILAKQSHPALPDLRRSYEYILSKVVTAVGSLGVKAEFFPISDIAFADSLKKFSGNAQKRGRSHILHHGTLLYRFDLSLIERYLAMPKQMPEYRKQRRHRDFVDNLPVNREQLIASLRDVFDATREEQGPATKEIIYLEKLKAQTKAVL